MGSWTDSVDEQAVIVMKQFEAACRVVHANNGELKDLHQPYLDLLRSVYTEDYTFAQMVDTSDFMARFTGPAVDQGEPNTSLAAKLFTIIHGQMRKIAKSVIKLDNPSLNWPYELDPKLTGIAPGSFYIGISIPSLDELPEERRKAFNITEQLYASVQAAIQLLPIVPDYIGKEGMEQSIEEKIPEQAMRKILIDAAINLAPTGKLGIDEVFLHGNAGEYKQKARTGPPKALTPSSRRILRRYLKRYAEDRPHQPIHIESTAIPGNSEMAAAGYDTVKENLIKEGSFQGVVRNIDLDDRRFELRQVEGLGTIQCRYASELDNQALNILNANVVVEGKYEAGSNQQPGLMDVTRVDIIQVPE